MNADVARLVCKEYKISCAEFILREDITVDQFIDVIEGNRAYIPGLYVFNKIDPDHFFPQIGNHFTFSSFYDKLREASPTILKK